MVTSFWDAVLLIIGFGSFLCIPLMLLGILGLFLRIAVQIVTPPQPTSPTERYTVPINRNSRDLALDSVDVKDLPDWLVPEVVNFPTAKDIKLLKEEEKVASPKIQNTLYGVLRWVSIILIFAIAYGGSLAVVQTAGNNLSPAIKVMLPALICLVIAVIGLAAVMVSVKGTFTNLQTVGWLLGFVTSIFFGAGIGLYAWISDNQCADPVCIYNNQIIGLTTGLGLLFAILFLVEWWNVWGEKYRTGNWTVGLIIGLVVTILLTLVGLPHASVIFGWIVSSFIILRGATGDSFYERRLLGLGVDPMLVAFIPVVGGIFAIPNCLCVIDLELLIWRWVAVGAAIGGFSGLVWLYLWQTAPYKAEAVRARFK